jgi:hypothetical protein
VGGERPSLLELPRRSPILLFDDGEECPQAMCPLSAVCRQPAPRPLRAGYHSQNTAVSRPCRERRWEVGARLPWALTQQCTLDFPHGRRVWNDIFMKGYSIKTSTSATACTNPVYLSTKRSHAHQDADEKCGSIEPGSLDTSKAMGKMTGSLLIQAGDFS